jgi:hypothetical protein
VRVYPNIVPQKILEGSSNLSLECSRKFQYICQGLDRFSILNTLNFLKMSDLKWKVSYLVSKVSDVVWKVSLLNWKWYVTCVIGVFESKLGEN